MCQRLIRSSRKYIRLVFQFSNCIFAESIDIQYTISACSSVSYNGGWQLLLIATLLILTFLVNPDSTIEKKTAFQAMRSPSQKGSKTEDRKPLAHGTAYGVLFKTDSTHPEVRENYSYLVQLTLEVDSQSQTPETIKTKIMIQKVCTYLRILV